jgi:hypothetical protein
MLTGVLEWLVFKGGSRKAGIDVTDELSLFLTSILLFFISKKHHRGPFTM